MFANSEEKETRKRNCWTGIHKNAKLGPKDLLISVRSGHLEKHFRKRNMVPHSLCVPSFREVQEFRGIHEHPVSQKQRAHHNEYAGRYLLVFTSQRCL